MPKPRIGANKGYIVPTRLTQSFHKLIKDVAAVEGTTASDLMRDATALYLANSKVARAMLKASNANPDDFPPVLAQVLLDLQDTHKLSQY